MNNNNNSNNTIIHIPSCGLWSSCHFASLVVPAPGTHPHIHTTQSSSHPAACVWSYCCCCCCWLVHKPIFLECCLRRASPLGGGRAGPHYYTKHAARSMALNGHWVRARACTASTLTLTTVVAKRGEDGARGQSNSEWAVPRQSPWAEIAAHYFLLLWKARSKQTSSLTASKAVMGRVTRP